VQQLSNKRLKSPGALHERKSTELG
jgi:hypothetical protein